MIKLQQTRSRACLPYLIPFRINASQYVVRTAAQARPNPTTKSNKWLYSIWCLLLSYVTVLCKIFILQQRTILKCAIILYSFITNSEFRSKQCLKPDQCDSDRWELQLFSPIWLWPVNAKISRTFQDTFSISYWIRNLQSDDTSFLLPTIPCSTPAEFPVGPPYADAREGVLS